MLPRACLSGGAKAGGSAAPALSRIVAYEPSEAYWQEHLGRSSRCESALPDHHRPAQPDASAARAWPTHTKYASEDEAEAALAEAEAGGADAPARALQKAAARREARKAKARSRAEQAVGTRQGKVKKAIRRSADADTGERRSAKRPATAARRGKGKAKPENDRRPPAMSVAEAARGSDSARERDGMCRLQAGGSTAERSEQRAHKLSNKRKRASKGGGN